MNTSIRSVIRRISMNHISLRVPQVVLPRGISGCNHLSADAAARTCVGVSTYVLHHNAVLGIFPIPGSSIQIARFHRIRIGTRQCTRRNLVYLRLKLTLALFFW
ncbi:hypothetical protein P280DRAFT_465748 [Massarina eburnea CBS 473.64]|uniref:Uncharacterized protein n=1 Tax=Massarina eburnea CBS 473.64 TaxID=1395130 RepID=A0A6A6S9I9_9PLEO|nr:hypothetical protein P280DRAFT_465748 [Massarina eburnea CBS 473.64]